MTVPYGAWMGSRIEDAFYAPHDLATEVQSFLAEHDGLYSRQTHNSVAVVYGVESNRMLIAKQDASDNVLNLRDESVTVPYRQVTADLAAAAVPYDVVILPDDATATDRVGVEQLASYPTVVLPHCTHLTQAQADALGRYVEAGGTLVVVGALATNLPAEVSGRLLGEPRVSHIASVEEATVDALLPLGRQVVVAGATEVSTNIQRLTGGGAAVHLLNYLYDEALDRTSVQTDVTVTVDVPVKDPTVTLYAGDGKVAELEVTGGEGGYAVRLPELGLYSVLLFEPRAAQDAPTLSTARSHP
jgi:hypothetical protein